jgi:hypothetical protein
VVGVKEDGEPKVDGLERAVLAVVEQHEVAGLDVAVEDAVRVALGQGVQHGAHAARGALLGVGALADGVEQLPAAAVLHHYVDVGVVLPGALEVHHAAGREGGMRGRESGGEGAAALACTDTVYSTACVPDAISQRTGS